MYLWRRRATQVWWSQNEEALRAIAGNQLAVIERPDRKQIELEVASRSRVELQGLRREFRGNVEKLRRDWLERSLRRRTRPIRVGNKKLTIPAGAAFGTAEHATTSMCLNLLERVMRFWGAQAPSLAGDRALAIANFSRSSFSARRARSPDFVVDLGTGSGILALAARLLGAKRVVAIDNDPTAIRVAKENARFNKIDNVTFRVGDVRRWKSPRKVDIVTANLFSELLVEILPRLKAARSLILSGLLREQERDVRRALTRNKIDIVKVQRRGKWVAMLARRR